MSGYFAEFAGEAETDKDADDLEDFDLDAPDAPVKSSEGASPRMEAYFAELERRMRIEYRIAEQCRALGLDPVLTVEIPPATDLAARCEELMKDYLPQRGVAERIRELSKQKNREETSLIVAKEVAAGRFGKFDSTEKAVDGAVRVGLAILTEGILVAPLEGIAGVRVLPNDDGSRCIAVSFAGPIRAAGGTGQALSVLIADVVRRELGFDRYKPTEPEVMRLKEEIPAYKMAANLQYTPTADEIDLIVRNCPIMIDGEGTEKDEVGGNRDLPRIQTNQIRGGACLVIAEGLTLKAPKIQKHVKNLKLEGWDFIDTFVNKGKTDEKKPDAGAAGAPARPPIDPNPKYMADLIAGRPVFSHPSRKGGWRLRYGRARTGGLATLAVHPAAMALVDDFLAVGTQMKIERPGKATVATPCDAIEPPIVLLHSGSLVELPTMDDVKRRRAAIRRIVDLGEILVPFGEFVENNKILPQSPYCVEWWELEVARAGHPGASTPATPIEAFAFAERTRTPLHPRFNLFWHDVTVADVRAIARFVLAHGRYLPDDRLALPKGASEAVVPANGTPASSSSVKELLVELGALHEVEGDVVAVDARYAYALLRGLGLDVADGRVVATGRDAPTDVADPCEAASALAGVRIRPRAPFRIGTRMGRPEKAAERKMAPPVHGLFPLGQAGGMQRLIGEAAKLPAVEVDVGMRQCPVCRRKTILNRCPECGPERKGEAHTVPLRPANAAGRPDPVNLPIADLWERAMRSLGVDRAPEVVKGVQGLISKAKTPEPIEKALLRAMHDVYTFKDGTTRFDMTDITLTHFKPREVHTSVEKLRELGYDRDVHGEPLARDDQILELLVQDVIVSTTCLDYMLKCAQFVDDELRRFYGFKPYYGCRSPEDLVGHLFVALAPHTSGGVLSRIIGHTKAQGHFGHPYFHAAKRRNCVTADTEIWIVEGGVATRRAIGPWVEERFRARRALARPLDAFGTEAVPVDGDARAISLDPVSGAPRLLRVTKAVRGHTTSWARIVTSTGRRFVCTPDHHVLTHEARGWTVKPADKVSPGDRVPVAIEPPPDVAGVTTPGPRPGLRGNEWYALDIVQRADVVESEGPTYCIDVDSGSDDLATKNVLWANGLYQVRCDGDEDCMMLLLDGLLNFSRSYLPSNRGGLMDAPLTLTLRLDPAEVDKEAHNVDVLWRYPLEFFEATCRHPTPKDVEKIMETVAKRLGRPSQYEGIGFTHDTRDIAEGPDASAYKTIGSMMEKMEAQLDLALKLRAVDAPDVAARVIGSHFLPDLMGNLKAFSKQGVRCTKCGAKYRRIPVAGRCIKASCGGNLTMTVFEASVKKYLEVSKQICERYQVNPYVRQRLEHIEDSIDSLFQNDRVKKAKLTDFF